MSPRFEAFVAQLYVDDAMRRRFLADPEGEATRAGLTHREIDALARIDRTGLELAARSFAFKRQRAERKRNLVMTMCRQLLSRIGRTSGTLAVLLSLAIFGVQ